MTQSGNSNPIHPSEAERCAGLRVTGGRRGGEERGHMRTKSRGTTVTTGKTRAMFFRKFFIYNQEIDLVNFKLRE